MMTFLRQMAEHNSIHAQESLGNVLLERSSIKMLGEESIWVEGNSKIP